MGSGLVAVVQMAGMQSRRWRVFGQHNFNPGRFEAFDFSLGRARVRIGKTNDHAHDPGAYNGIDAGRRPPPMAAGLQRNIERCANRIEPGGLERRRLGVGPATPRGHCAAIRVWLCGATTSAAAQGLSPVVPRNGAA